VKGKLNEIQRLQKIAGLLKEEDLDLSDTPDFTGGTPEEVYDLIVDWASSGRISNIGPAEGLVHGAKEIKAAISGLSRKKREELSSILDQDFEYAEGWTNGDKEFLNSLGLNITAKPHPYEDFL
jgi:hypothetical protein